jgi:hypothetical protein
MIENLSHWPTTKVGRFFSALPWYGRVAQTILTEEPSQVDWRLLSVQEFFSNLSWNGRGSESETPFVEGQELSYLLSVREFWGRFAWQGRPKIGVVQELNLNQFKDPELSLNDLSDLF